MPKEEIITVLKNAIERGESLQTAMQIMVNSGYNPREVQEASKYVGGMPVNMQAKPGEQLTMPEKKSFFSRFKRSSTKPRIQQSVPQQPVRKETKSYENLGSPNKSPFLKKGQPSLESQPPQIPIQNVQRVSPNQEARQIRQQITEPKPILPQVEVLDQEEKEVPLAKQLNKLTPKKHSHGKEIMLLIILLVLIGILITTIFLKNTIIGWFS